jgi:type I restriction enzyme S subunit
MREGWEIKKLDELFDVKSSKRVHKADWKTEGVPFYRAREVVKLAQNGYVNNELFISEELFQEFTKEKGGPKEGDIIISAVGTLGQCYLVKKNDRFYFKDASVLWFENTSNVYTRYIDFAFKSDIIMEQVMDKSMGATVGTLTISRAKIIKIPIPPLQEQKEIVAILDQAFEAIDQAKANIEKNIANAKEFQISATNNLFTSIDDSELLSIDDITDFITDYVANGSFASLSKNVNYKSEKDYAVLLRLTDHSKKFKNDFVYVDKHSFNFLKKSTVYPNDIILSNVGARLGTAFRAPDLGIPMTLGPNAILIKAEKLGDYLFCWLQSAYGQNAIKSVVSGAGQPKFNKTQFKKIKVPIPKEESARLEVVNKINLAESEFERLYKNYQKKMDLFDELKKSILQKAFAGELTDKEVEA